MVELKPCPFCRNPARRSTATKSDPYRWAVGCSVCAVVTEWMATESAAETVWNTRPPITDEAIERVARVIAPGHWQVMDSYLAETKRKYAGQNAAYDPDQFKHKESMATARAAIDAFWGGGECHES